MYVKVPPLNPTAFTTELVVVLVALLLATDAGVDEVVVVVADDNCDGSTVAAPVPIASRTRPPAVATSLVMTTEAVVVNKAPAVCWVCDVSDLRNELRASTKPLA